MATDIDKPDTTSEQRRPASRGAGRRNRNVKPMRTVAIFAAVGALVAAVALPAYAATTPTVSASESLHAAAVDDAQSLVVASEATAAPIARGNYSATTPKEIAKKKAEAAAAKRAKERAAAAAAAAAQSGTAMSTEDIQLVASGSGDVRYPLPRGSYQVSRTLGNGHNGADMAGPAGTPIYAATSGVVRVSSESYYGYGVAVVIDGVVGGQRVSTTYAHMIYGSRQVQAGQTVQAGQMIGQRGNTGNSYGAHLHFEVEINGSLVEPIGWLAANAG